MAPNSIFGRDDDEAPVEPETSEGVRLLDAEEVAKAAERAETAKRKAPDEKKYGDRPEPPPGDVKPAMRFPLADTADPNDFDRPRPAPVTPPTADDPTGSRTVLSVGPPTAETALPHWTEPATGEVPRVLIGDEDDDEGKWAAFAAASPRWRDENTDWDAEEAHTFDDLSDDAEQPLGALDETERPMDEDFLTFDDLEVPDAAPPRRTVGTAADPIKIQRTGRAPLPAPGAGPARPPRAARPGPAADRPSGAAAPAAGRDRDEAIRVGAMVAGGALLVFVIGFWVQWFPLLLITAAIVGALAEFFNAAARAGFRPLRQLGLLAAGALPVAAYFGGTPANPGGESGVLLALFLLITASLAWYLFGAGKGRPVANIAITWAGVLYVGLLGSYAALLLRAGPWASDPANTGNKGVQYVILIAVGTVVCDVAAYLLGSKIGKTPLSAASPNKTIEGLAAGMGVSLLVTLVLGGLFHLGTASLGQAFLLGVVVAVVAPVGDLFESMIKRDLGVKDMGSVLPSHGGLLDRLDAFLFTLPAGYYVLKMVGLIA